MKRTRNENDRTQSDGATWAQANARTHGCGRICSVCGTPEKRAFVEAACKARREQLAAGRPTWKIAALADELRRRFGIAVENATVQRCVREHHMSRLA